VGVFGNRYPDEGSKKALHLVMCSGGHHGEVDHAESDRVLRTRGLEAQPRIGAEGQLAKIIMFPDTRSKNPA
jgi:hypothetical protein